VAVPRFASRSIASLAVVAFVAGTACLASAAGPSPDPSPAAVTHQKSLTPAPAPAPAPAPVSPAPVSPAPSVSAPVVAPKPKAKAPVAKKAPVKKKTPAKRPVKHPVVKAPAPKPKPVAVPVQPAPVVVPLPPPASHSSSRVWLVVLGAVVVLAILGLLFWAMRRQLAGMTASAFRRLGRSLRRRPAIPAVEDAEVPTKFADADTTVSSTPYVRSYLEWLGHE
jgi:outer membrane biosynthesis protein TonB